MHCALFSSTSTINRIHFFFFILRVICVCLQFLWTMPCHASSTVRLRLRLMCVLCVLFYLPRSSSFHMFKTLFFSICKKSLVCERIFLNACQLLFHRIFLPSFAFFFSIPYNDLLCEFVIFSFFIFFDILLFIFFFC